MEPPLSKTSGVLTPPPLGAPALYLRTYSLLPTLNAHYRLFFVSKISEEHVPVPLNKLTAFSVVVAMNIDILENILN